MCYFLRVIPKRHNSGLLNLKRYWVELYHDHFTPILWYPDFALGTINDIDPSLITSLSIWMTTEFKQYSITLLQLQNI